MSLDGLISFFASHYAIRAEAVLQRAGFEVQLIPGPKELSPNCGVALRFEFARRAEAVRLLDERLVKIDQINPYLLRTDSLKQESEPASDASQRRRRWPLST